jgi:hypothetical protein
VDSLTGVFRFPIDIEITTASGIHRYEYFVDEREEIFLAPVDDRPVMVIVDKGLHVLKSLTHQKTRAELLYLLANGGEGIERLDACEGLSAFGEESEVLGALGRAALDDPFWAVRTKAVNMLGDMEVEEGQQVFEKCLEDADPRVRSAAVDALGSYPKEEAITLLEKIAREDSSYLVLATCIRTLARMDSSRGFDLASSHAGMDSYRDMVRSASLNALRRIKDPRAIPIALRFLGPGYETSTRLIAVGILEDLGKNDASAITAMGRLADNPNVRIRLAAVRGLGAWQNATARDILRERKLRETEPDILKAIDEALDS